MYMIQNCRISDEVLSSWEAKYVPRHNVFFFEKEDSAIEWLGAEVMLLSREQWRLGRGQVMPLDWVEEEVLTHVSSADQELARLALQPNLFETPEGQMVALQHDLWWQFPREVRVQFLLARAKLSAYYPSVWPDLSQEEQQRVTVINPIIATTDLQPGDILVWFNEQDTPVHACFALGNGLVFNTNGQTMFDPWQVLRVRTLLEHWGDVVQEGGSVEVYRKAKQPSS